MGIEQTIRQMRDQLVGLREEIEDLIDYLDLLEARARDSGRPRLSLAQVSARYGLK
ncbi:MAG TPA: hypothetical protein VLZ12_15740 [Verrucomicrobiae bacterium]|nr:hypothetical protein [Verrucomicrobiae bacterium]